MTAAQAITTVEREVVLKEKHIPNAAISRFGCMHCPDRHTKDCPHFDMDTLKVEAPQGGICDKRLEWLMSLTPNYERRPSLSQFLLDVTKAQGHIRSQKDARILEKMEWELTQCNDDTKQKDLMEKIDKGWMRWFALNKHLTHYEDLQVDRETPKKVEMTHETKVRPQDIGKLIQKHGKVYDVDFKVEK